MNFVNPWAWLGAALVMVPVLVHMLARSRAPRQSFPTLRFFEEARIVAVRRSRITDIPLLLLRSLLVLLAVMALAQPYLRTEERQARLAQSVVRVTLVDTSASMHRLTADGETALAAARRMAAAEADARTTVVETAAPGAVLGAAGELLSRRSGVREVLVLSDFQAGALHDTDVAVLPAGTGLRLDRVAVVAGREAQAAASPAVALLAGAQDRARGEAVLAAAVNGLPASGDERRVVLLMAGYEGAVELLRRARAPGEAWAALAIAAMRQDEVLAEAARVAREGAAAGAVAEGGLLVPVVRSPDGAVLVHAATLDDEGGSTLLLVAERAAGDLVAAAAVAAASRSLAEAVPARERNTATIAEDALRGWERDAVAATAGAVDTGSDGRWLWLAVLVLLGVEALMRRRMVAREPAHA